jgi:hypothetical protein
VESWLAGSHGHWWDLGPRGRPYNLTLFASHASQNDRDCYYNSDLIVKPPWRNCKNNKANHQWDRLARAGQGIVESEIRKGAHRMKTIHLGFLAGVLTFTCAPHALAAGHYLDVAEVNLSTETFAHLRKQIRPQPGESRWMEIPWLIDVHEARKKASAEGKPLFVYSGGGASGIGAC